MGAERQMHTHMHANIHTLNHILLENNLRGLIYVYVPNVVEFYVTTYYM